jgi:hypothetical protein
MVTGVTDPTDVRVRTGFWRFGAQRARLGLEGQRLTLTSVDPDTGQANSLIVSGELERITAFASGSVITLEIEGNPYRIDFGGRGWPQRITEWRTLLEFAGLPVPYRSMHPVKTVLLTVAGAIVLGPYAFTLTLFVVTRLAGAVVGVTP